MLCFYLIIQQMRNKNCCKKALYLAKLLLSIEFRIEHLNCRQKVRRINAMLFLPLLNLNPFLKFGFYIFRIIKAFDSIHMEIKMLNPMVKKRSLST